MKQYAVIGDPIIHSLSPLLHNEIYNQIGTLISYKKHQIKETGLSSRQESHIKIHNLQGLRQRVGDCLGGATSATVG